MSLLPVAIITLFLKRHIGLTMTEILLVEGSFGLVVAVFEFPSGYLADRMGYKQALVTSFLVGAIGWTIYGIAHSVATVIVAEVFLGISISLASGTDSAMLYESLKIHKLEGDFATYSGRMRFWGQSGEATAALAAGVIFTIHPSVPFLIQACLYLTGALLMTQLQGITVNLKKVDSHTKHALAMMTYSWNNRELRNTFLLVIALGLASFIPVWLIPLHAIELGNSDYAIGIIWAIANYNVALASLASASIVKRFGLLALLCVSLILLMTGYAGLALSHATFGFAWYYCLTTMRGIFGPALNAEEQKLIPSGERAGYLSLRSLSFRLSFLLLTPLIGTITDMNGFHTTFAYVGIALTSLTAMCAFMLLCARNKTTKM